MEKKHRKTHVAEAWHKDALKVEGSCADQWQAREELLLYVGTGIQPAGIQLIPKSLTLSENDSRGVE